MYAVRRKYFPGENERLFKTFNGAKRFYLKCIENMETTDLFVSIELVKL